MASFILGISGKKRSGKDTFARFLCDHGFVRLAFADALKDTLLATNPIVGVDTWQDEYELSNYGIDVERLRDRVTRVGWERAKDTPEVRRLLQAHGVAIREHVDPDVWVNAVARKAEQIPGPVVVTDVRFPNEADWIESVGGKLVRIVRPGRQDEDMHVSEVALDDRPVHHAFVNVGPLARLREQAEFIAGLYGPSL